jgi:hypothetical protein
MSVNKMLGIAVVLVAAVATVIAAVGLLHELTAPGTHDLVHSLESWMVHVGYHLALILLAAAGVNYLVSKK